MSLKKIIVISVLFALILIVFFFILPRLKKDKQVESLPPATPSAEDRIEEKFNGLVIPDDVEKIELKNVSGEMAIGVATKEGIYADLPDLKTGEIYQVLITNGLNTIALGSLRQSKGGYILEYNLSKYPGYDTIFITRGQERILEGSF